MNKLITTILLLLSVLTASAAGKQFRISENSSVKINAEIDTTNFVSLAALEMFTEDIGDVMNCNIQHSRNKANISASLDLGKYKKHLSSEEVKFLSNTREGFIHKVLADGTLLILGSDRHGLAYGILELSRLIGVSPWKWWADANVDHKKEFVLPAGYTDCQSPSVQYRGIFINDEDWGLMPWSSSTMEPENKRGVVGAKTTERIFQLLLRLRANTYWPPMHECTEPFFLTPGCREMARKYGIYIGGSHCEPMASSTAVEWGRRGVGAYDYTVNSHEVARFWESRVKEVADQEIIFTLGMRGMHDGAMNGAKTVAEQKAVLSRVFADQRAILARILKQDIQTVPQVFIPYKEVLDVYDSGLEVPDDVTLMWTDDNYGYIKHFPDETERNRQGGNGMYYHISYWGRPHDYLWLGTQSPYLLHQQMSEAFDRGIQKMWILNVGDIKPSEYQIELFMDLAWDVQSVDESGVDAHLNNFLSREFGASVGKRLLPFVQDHYRLSFIRKPEHLGNTRCEERGPGSEKWTIVSDLPWSDSYISDRIAEYSALSDSVELIYEVVPSHKRDAYFQLVKYPLQATAEMNKKMLFGQLARHGKAPWRHCVQAHDSIQHLTAIYNKGIYNNGKWNGILDAAPRKLPVFMPLDTTALSSSIPATTEVIIDAIDYNTGKAKPFPGLGYNGNAVEIPVGNTLSYRLTNKFESDSIDVILEFIPTHPVDTQAGLKVELSFDNHSKHILDYTTHGRSEEWKQNVLTNHAVRKITIPNCANPKVEIKALSATILLDRIILRPKGDLGA